ncbi:glycoside hydrolase family 1 protein [Nocardia pseudobrasiliensis]|uniref:glycoside hydrolase family 1 protein n=1 Tax=Nocardia pseudobrasiliensis TaxID=45979 RepID=UPI0009EE7315
MRRTTGLRRATAFAFTTAVLLTLVGIAPTAAQAAPPLSGDFLWGVSSSGFQSEGSAPDSNWSRYANSDAPPDRYGNSVDFYHRYREDIGLAAAMGTRVYRIGVEWARVQTRPGEWDPQGLAFYDNVIGAIRAAGMRPMITLDHWGFPGWEIERGGWGNPGMVDDWLAYARTVTDRYAGDDPLWITFNEPNVGPEIFAAQGNLPVDQIGVAMDRQVAAHRAIYDYIHSRQPNAMVTSNVNYSPGYQSVADIPFLNRIADKLDYIGIDYYYGNIPSPADLASNTPWANPLQPEGIYYALRHYARLFPDKPLFIIENGMPTKNGEPRADGWTRPDALRDTVYWLQRAKADGIDVIGYNYWALTDNYEWGSYTPRFGLYTVDVKSDPTLTRRPTDGVPAYRDIIAHGGVPADYHPTRPPTRCSIVDPPASCVEPVR